ncbi:hypothetical protein ACSYBF_08640 [Klebsiella quasipneumoniae subsp. similipneumoniae]|uniref:hypothetical protein n=1 Tax=Klebsiella quasipneumoniae TaxID=1463165 RepID=UPI003F66623E
MQLHDRLSTGPYLAWEVKMQVHKVMRFHAVYTCTQATDIKNPALAGLKEGANKQVISSQADSLIKISRIWADFFPANTSNQPV